MNPSAILEITTDDLHTGGEPVRIVTGGYPEIKGATVLDKRAYAAAHLDHLRRFLMWEPRGHRDMYGVLPVPADDPEAAFAVLFMHNEGYSTMCGHATIALGRWAIETGRVAGVSPVTRFVLQCPCGPVAVAVEIDEEGRPGRVSFKSVPAFALMLDREVDVDGIGRVRFDIGYGGAFYAIVAAEALGVTLDAPIATIQDVATRLCDAVKRNVPIVHPDASDLGYLYGAILTDGGDGLNAPSTNICVFADAQIDRSPTGSGVTARVALAAARGVDVVMPRLFRSVTGAVFEGRTVGTTTCGTYPAVMVEVAGRSYWSGRSSFTLEPDDAIGNGFLLR